MTRRPHFSGRICLTTLFYFVTGSIIITLAAVTDFVEVTASTQATHDTSQQARRREPLRVELFNEREAAAAQVLVKFREGLPAHAAEQIKQALDIHSDEAVGGIGVRLLRSRSKDVSTLIRALSTRPDVVYAEPNFIRRADSAPNDPSYKTFQYGLRQISADLTWDEWQPSAQVVIAILDTGVDHTHPDLTNVIHRENGDVKGYNSLLGEDPGDVQDDHGHGTHCAGIAAAQINNGLGVAGVAGWNPNVAGSDGYIKLMPVKVLDSQGSGTDAEVAAGVIWAADNEAKVISMSLGGPDFSNTLDDAVQYAWGRGSVVVAAAGNSGVSSKYYPAAYDNVISVAATDSADQLTYFSNYGPWVKVAAPGNSIFSTYPGGGYQYSSGTSQACPHVSGEVAAILAQYPDLTNADAYGVVTTSTDPYMPFWGGIAAGGGRVNAYRALLAAGGVEVQADLSVQQTASPVPVLAGGKLTYAITVNNAGPQGAYGVTLTDTLPADAKYYSVKASQGSCARTTTVTCKLGNLSGGATATVTLVVTVGAGEAVVNTVSVKSGAPDPNAADNSSTSSLPITPQANLAVTITDAPDPLLLGDNVTFTITLTNKGPSAATGVVMSTALASALGFVSAETSAGTCAQSATTVTCNIGNMVNGSSVTVRIVAKTLAGGMYTSKASVTSNETDSFTTNNTGSVTTRIVTLSSVLSAIVPGSCAGYTSKVTLTAPAPAGGVVVGLVSTNTAATVPTNVTIPAGSSYVYFTITSTPVTASQSGTLTARLGDVTKSATLTVRPIQIKSFTLNPLQVVGGTSSTGTVILECEAPTGGITVTFSSTNLNVAKPAVGSITIPSSTTSGSLMVNTTQVQATTSAGIYARANGSSKLVYLKVTP